MILLLLTLFTFLDVVPDDLPPDVSPGEMGPNILILQENDLASQTNYTQTIQLHHGWNLVSWHIDLDPNGQWETQYIPGILQNQTWFSQDERLYRYGDAENYYPLVNPPPPLQWPWEYEQAYYLLILDDDPWQYTERPQYPLTGSGFGPVSPSDAWDEADYGQWQNPEDERFGEYWYFISYPVPGYTKLATVYDDPQNPNGANTSYNGPFHWLIWDVNHPNVALKNTPGAQYLTIVKTDDGRHYIPYIPGYVPQEIDEIGVLEPGRGYFLGFFRNGEFEFNGWDGYPGAGWESVPGDPKATQKEIASATHFQYNKYTHWSYPVVVDSFAIAGVELETGDEFGIFSSDLCVGAREFEGEFPLVITTWKDDKATPDEIDGYSEGDEMVIKLYDASENEEMIIDLGPQTMAAEQNMVAPSHSGFGRGSFAKRSLTYGIKSTLQLPDVFKLSQNFPNPFNAETVIPLELPQRSNVTVEIFDVTGRKVWTITAGTCNPGTKRILFNAYKLTSGVYFYRVTAEGLERGGTYQDIGKMLLLK